MKKRVSILLVFFLFVSLFSWIQPVRALDPANVTPVPHTGGQSAKYTITFALGSGAANNIPATGYFKITFPTDTKLPTSIAKANVTINALPLNVDPTISGLTVKLMAPDTYNGGDTITIVFVLAASIKNPMSPTGMVRLKVETGYMVGSTETKIEAPVDSNKYFIGFPATVTPSPNTDTPANGTEFVEYKIAWKTGNEGALTKNTDTITIIFDNLYTLATWPGLGYIPGSYFTINGTAVTSNAVCSAAAPLTITLKTPVDIGNSAAVTIIMTTQVGLTNPVADDYQVTVRSNKETKSTHSYDYTIVDAVSFVDLQPLTPASVQGVVVTPSSVSSEAEYRVGIEVDIPLTATLGTISITFPTGTILPSTIAMSDILFSVNGTPSALTLTPTKSSQTIVITVPVNIVAADEVEITFLVSMKIKNPANGGNYSIRAFTSAQPFYRLSPPYAIGTAVTAVKVTPSPNTKESLNVVYTVDFKLGSSGALKGNDLTDRIFIELELGANPGATLPAASVSVGTSTTTYPCIADTIVTPLGGDRYEFEITPPKDIAASQAVKVIFQASAQLANPLADSYRASVWTSREMIPVDSEPYQITDAPDIIDVDVSPTATDTVARYAIQFSLTTQLLENFGIITVVFPTGTSVPTTIPLSAITIDHNIADANPAQNSIKVTVKGQQVDITIPQTITTGVTAEIVFTLSAGIKNPKTADLYRLQMMTSAQPYLRLSLPYAIGTAVTAVKVTPTPNNISGNNVEYKIEFKNGTYKLTKNIDTINIFLDLQNTATNISAAAILVNNVFTELTTEASVVALDDPDNVRGVDVGFLKYAVPVPMDINASQQITVIFLTSCALQNPSDEGITWGFVSTFKERIPVRSELYNIMDSVAFDGFNPLGLPPDFRSVVVKPNAINLTAQYLIQFKTSSTKTPLQANLGTITIAFPSGTKIPSSISSGSVYVYVSPDGITPPLITLPDGIICPPPAPWVVVNQPVYVSSLEVRFVTPIEIPSGSNVYVVFCTSANIQNPPEAGLYTLQVKTSSQPNYGIPRPYLIRSTIEKPTVTPLPAIISERAEYTIKFKTGSVGELLANSDWIYVALIVRRLPTDVNRYVSPAGGTTIPASFIKINGQYLNIAATVRAQPISTLPTGVENSPGWDRYKIIDMQVPVNIAASSDVSLLFSLDANIINPITPDNYTLLVWTNKEPVAIESYIYTIDEAVSNVIVPSTFPRPRTIGSIAEYCVQFTTGTSGTLLDESGTITVTFPEGTTLPSYINPANIRISTAVCGNIAPTTSALSPVTIEGQSVKFTVPMDIGPGTQVCVWFLQSAQIKNPSKQASYRLIVKTSAQPIDAYSNYYSILETNSIPKVSVVPAAINYQNAAYTIEFNTGSNGALSANFGKIYIFFNPNYNADYILNFGITQDDYPTLPNTIPPNSVLVNDIPVNSYIKKEETGGKLNYLEITTPIDIAASSSVKVNLSRLVGITNPNTVGPYYLAIMTSSELTPILSQEFSLFSAIGTPTVTLSVSNNTRPNPDGNTPMANAQYRIQFTTGSAGNLIQDFSTITIQFPDDTVIPDYISPSSITVDPASVPAQTIKVAPIIDVANRKVTMTVPMNIGNTESVDVIFTELANLKNPSQPGSYVVWVSTSSEPIEIKSTPYMIEGVSGAKVTLSPCLFDATSVKYIFEFTITKALAAANYIYIDFPYGTRLASVIYGSSVLVNGKPANIGTFPQVEVDKQQVQIRIPEAIPALSQVKVEFLPEARITNPGIGMYVAKIRTDIDTNPVDLDNDPDNRWVETQPYYICSDATFTKIEITPSTLTLAKGETKSLSVIAKDENDKEITYGLTYQWSVLNSIGSVSPNNTKQVTFTAGQNAGKGSVKVAVTFNGLTLDTTADVTISASLASVNISPASASLGLNQSQVFVATAYDEIGNEMSLDIEWSSTGSVGSFTPVVGKQTTFTATSVGSGTIKAKATFNSISKEASASVTVSSTPPPPPPPPDGDQVVTGALTPASVRANQGDVAIQITITALLDISTGGVVELTIPEMWPSPSTVAGAQGFVTALAKSPAVITVPPTVNGRVISVNVQKMVKGNSFTISYSKVSAPSTPGEYSFPLKAKSTATGSFVSVTDAPKILVTSISDGSGRAAITPNEASAGAEGQKFEITYTADAVMDGGAVSFTMPDGWSKPSLVPTVQGFVQLKEPNGNFGAIEVFDATVTVPVMKLGVNQKVTLVYTNVRIPNVENTYTFIVKSKGLGGDLKNIALNPTVAVRTTRADTVKVEVIPNMTSVPAEYTITFKASKTGFMAKDTGSITFVFPPETGIPTTIKSELITVNGNPLKSPPEVDSIRSTVKIVTPVDLDPAVLVQVKFALDTGITNPKTAKEDYKVRLYTSTDTLPADSATYRIIVSSLRNIKVAVSPIVPGASAQYRIQAKVGGAGALNVNQDSITVIFPADTTLPSSIAANLVTVNGTALQMRPTIDITQRKMTVLLPVKVDNDSEFTLIVASEANVKNPSRDGMYKVKVFTSKEINPIESESYQIGQSLLGDVKVNLSTSLVEATNVTYTISFRTGAYGSLVVGETITVTFDRRYILPSIQAYQISVNGVVCTVTPEVREGHSLIINTPIGISSESTATLTVSGITNPNESGEYNLSLSTKAEPNPVMSTSYRIGLVLETEIAINPTEANGLAGWYTIAPNIVLSNAIPSARIFYAWDDGPFSPYTGSSITAPEGIHTFYCYSTAEGLDDEPKKSLLTKVDTKGPVIQLTQPTEGNTFFVPDITVEGNVDEANDFTVTVNGKPATVTNKRFTITITLNPGDNWLDIVATDAAGNRSITPRIRVNYTQPSEIKITVTSPKALTSVYPILKATTGGASQLTAVLRVTGKIEPANATEISVYILGKMLNPVKLPVAADGTFDGDVEVPLVSGLNGITLTVKDKTTGKEFQTSVAVIAKVTLRLQIGNALAFLNDKEYRLDAPPYIKNARTMVPMRFIGESLGASVTWVAATKSVIYVLDSTQIQFTIGNTNAIVTQGEKKQTIKLDAAPEIVNSRTFIPLRFVSENFGAAVEWNEKEKKITVTK